MVAKGLQSAIRVLVDAEAGPIRKDIAVWLGRGAVAKSVARQVAVELLVDRRSKKLILVRRIEIGHESGADHLSAHHGTADPVIPLEDEHLPAGAGQVQRRDEPVVAGSNDNRILAHRTALLACYNCGSGVRGIW